jgi:hypothetical protein
MWNLRKLTTIAGSVSSAHFISAPLYWGLAIDVVLRYVRVLDGVHLSLKIVPHWLAADLETSLLACTPTTAPPSGPTE